MKELEKIIADKRRLTQKKYEKNYIYGKIAHLSNIASRIMMYLKNLRTSAYIDVIHY